MYLKWYRDHGRGQEAADAIKAEQTMDVGWPIAVLTCPSQKHADAAWEYLLAWFDVNAICYAHYPVDKERP